MVDGIKSDAALKPGCLIAETLCHPGMGALMKAERENKQDELEDGNCKLSRLQKMLP